MNAFYTYMWLREDGTPYYIGKGSGKRAFYSSAHFVHCPPDKTRIVIQPRSSEAEALEAEKFLIAQYGRLDLGTGCLRNRTDGGENPPKAFGNKYCLGKTPHNKGKKMSEEQKEKLKLAHIGKKLTLEHRQNIGKSIKGRRVSEATKALMSVSQCARWAIHKATNTGVQSCR